MYQAVKKQAFTSWAVSRLICLLLLTSLASGSWTAPARASAYEDGIAAFEAGDHLRAMEIWVPLANAGDAVAQYSLGKLYEQGGNGVQKDPAQAVQWYRQAAIGGVAAAENNLALMYARGQGVQRDLVRAAELWRMAAERGHPMAQYNIGLALFNGDGVSIDREESVAWFRRAADAGVADAQYVLGQFHRQGVVLASSMELAIGWYELAAAQGHAGAREQVARLKSERDAVQETRKGDDAKQTEHAEPKRKPDMASPSVTPAKAEPSVVENERSAEPETEVLATSDAESDLPSVVAGDSDERAQVATVIASDSAASGETAISEAGSAEAAPMKLPDADEVAQAEPSIPPAPSIASVGQEKAAEAGVSGTEKDQVNPLASVPVAVPGAPPTSGEIDSSQPVSPVATTAVGDTSADIMESQSEASGPLVTLPASETPASETPASETPASETPPAISEQVALTTEPTISEQMAPETSVWLASATDESKADEMWRRLLRGYPIPLAGYQPRYKPIELSDVGTLYRVLVGPFSSRADAEALCADLRSVETRAFCSIQDP